MKRYIAIKLALFSILFFSGLSTRVACANDLVQTFTLDGEVYQVNSTSPLLDTNLNITVQILNPGKTCVLYEEQQWVDTNASGGLYNIQVGSNTGATKRSSGDSNNSMQHVFQNNSAIAGKNADSATCTGNSYTPGNRDARYMRLIITPSATNTADILSPDTSMDSVPTAWVAQTLQGKSPSEFAQINSTSAQLSQANLESVFSNINFPKLQDLLDGTSTQYLSGSPTATMDWNAQRITNLGIPVSSTDAATKGYADSNLGGSVLDLTGISSTTGNGKTLVWDQTNNKWVAQTAGSVSYLRAGTGLLGGTVTSTGTISVDVGVGANKIVQLTNNGVLPAIDAYLLTNLNAPVTSVAGRTGAVTLNAFDITNLGTAALRDYGTSANQLVALTNNAVLPALDGFLLTNLNASYLQSRRVASTAPTSGQILTWNSSLIQWEPMTAATAGITDLTGDVTATGPGAVGATIANSVITSRKINATGYAINRLLITDGTDPNIVTYANCTNGDILMYGATGWTCSAQLANVNASAFTQGGNAFGQVGTLGTTDTANLNIIAGGSTRMTVTSTGNIGIGTTGPATTLDISIGSWTSGQLIIGATGNAGRMFYRRGSDGVATSSVGYDTNGSETFTIRNGGGGGEVRLNASTPTGYNTLYTNDLERMRIDPSGNVGIGSTTPKSILELSATGTNSALLIPRDTTANRPTGNLTNGMMRYNTTDSKFEFYQAGSWVNYTTTSGSGTAFAQGGNAFGQVATLGTTDTANLNVITGGSTRMTVTSAGDVGIGTTAPRGGLQVSRAAAATTPSVLFDGNWFSGGSSSTTTPTVLIQPAGTTSSSWNTDGTALGINANGAFTGRMVDIKWGGNTVFTVSGSGNFEAKMSGRITANSDPQLVFGPPEVTNSVNDVLGRVNFQGVDSSWNTFSAGSMYVTATSVATNAASTAMRFQTANGGTVADRMSITSAGNVGIGTTTPQSLLELTATGTNSALLLPRDTTANRPAGNVTNGMMRYNTSDAKFEFYQAGGWVNFAPTTGTGSSFVQGGNAFGQVATLGTTDTANLNVITGGSTRMTVTSEGNVGIGTTAPGAKLHVMGDLVTDGSVRSYAWNSNAYSSSATGGLNFPDSAYHSIDNTATTPGTFSMFRSMVRNGNGILSGYMGVVSPATGYTPALVFGQSTGATSYAERMRIHENGNIGIGTTSPMAKLSVDLPTRNVGGTLLSFNSDLIQVNDENWADTRPSEIITKDSTFGFSIGARNGPILLSSGDNGYNQTQERMRITTAGNVGVGTTNPQAKLHVNGTLRVDTLNAATATHVCIDGNNVLSACSSSIRYKENVFDLNPSLETILNLRPVSYDWIQSKEHDVGFIAEEVEKIDSRYVTYNKENKIQGVKYEQLVAPTVKAIQELYHSLVGTQADVETLKAENEKLKQENAAIKAYLCTKDPNAAICK